MANMVDGYGLRRAKMTSPLLLLLGRVLTLLEHSTRYTTGAVCAAHIYCADGKDFHFHITAMPEALSGGLSEIKWCFIMGQIEYSRRSQLFHVTVALEMQLWIFSTYSTSEQQNQVEKKM